MELGFDEPQAAYVSGSQNARVWTERWVGKWVFCPSCGNRSLDQFAANSPVADFLCPVCHEEFELKSQKKAFGRKILDGAYRTMKERLAASNNPSLLLLNYDLERLAVTNVMIVPKHFFVEDIIEKRKPLAFTARRAGWVGCNILLASVPASGKIYLVRNGLPEPKDAVLAKWRQTLFLREQGDEARGWLIETMKCVDAIGNSEFDLSDVYAYEARLSAIYPNNRHVKQKIRQQLQVLRDHGYLEFVRRGHYRLKHVR